MSNKEMETAPRQQLQSPDGATGKCTDSSLDHLPADVKAIVELQDNRHIPTADIVEVVAAIYPKFDRFLLSKVRHGDETGVRLRADAQHELLTHFKVTQDASKEDDDLTKEYAFLESLGYVMSDFEKSLQDGSHPFFEDPEVEI